MISRMLRTCALVLLSALLVTTPVLAQPAPEANGPAPVRPEECARCQWRQVERLVGQLRTHLVENDLLEPELLLRIQQALGCVAMRREIAALKPRVDLFEYQGVLTWLDALECAQGRRFRFEVNDGNR